MSTMAKDLVFKAFSDIENVYRTKTINEIIIQGLSGGEWVVSEKVHGCLHEDTKIMLPNGETVSIKDIRAGDAVLAYNYDSGEFVIRTVKGTLIRPTDGNWMKLTFDNENYIICTDNHRFLTKNRGWVEAKELTESDDIVDIF